MSSSCRVQLRRLLVTTAVLAFGYGAHAAELPLTRVVLSTAGIAQFTLSGAVSAGSTVDVAVRFDQVDDILKSLTVFDKAGAIGPVSLPGREPMAELFRDLPFGPDALDSSRALLTALVGSEVEIAGPVNAKGRLFRVEDQEVELPNNGGTTVRHRLTLMTGGGLVQAILEDVTTLHFSDPQVTAQVERALADVAENHARERRRLSIGFLGEGTRNAAVSYMTAAPIWKTAYRLVLPRDGGNARLQGWAVVENLSGGDWNDIELVLVSGNPVALHQPLYTAVLADRVEVPVTTVARLKPGSDDADEKPASDSAVPAAPAPAKRGNRVFAPATGPAKPAAGAEVHQFGGGTTFDAAPAAPPPGLGKAANAAEAEEASTQLLYRFPGRISLATGHTMMVPFVDREVPAVRAWLYQPEVSARHPLAAVRVRNDGDTGLPPGIVTAYETAGDDSVNFVGDAQLPLLPRSTPRFVTFALDSKTDIRREDKGVSRTQLGKAVNGVLTLTTRSRREVFYEITAPSDEDRQIVIEEVRAEGWKPVAETGVEETPTRFRHAVTAPHGQVTRTSLVLERTDSETVTLTTLSAESILTRIAGLQNEGVVVTDAVAKLGAIVSDINQAGAQRARLESERKKIGEDQARIRQNLQSVGPASDLGRRYLETLKSQEERLADIGKTDARLENDITVSRRAAKELAQHLTL